MSTKDNMHPGDTPRKAGKPKPEPEKTRRRRRRTQKKTSAEVVYTQPTNFSRKRFLLQLGTMVVVVIALLFGMSLFFKVDHVSVSGVEKYTGWDIYQACGIQEGDNLLTISKARVASRIYERLPYVKSVRIARKLPDTVLIEIRELDVTYAVETDGGDWWLMRSDGVILEKIESEVVGSYTRIQGVKVLMPTVGEKAVPAEPEPAGTYPDGSTVPVTTTGQERLTAAMSIMQNLEKNGILGAVTRIDVSDLWDLQLRYDDRIQVLLGENTRMEDKIGDMAAAILDTLKPYAKGILDVSMADGKTREPIFKDSN